MLNLLPPEGTLLTMKIVHELRQDLAFSEEELAALKFQQSNDRLQWENTVEPKEIEVGVKAMSTTYDLLEKLNKEEKITEAHLTLCEKFEYTG